MKFYFAAELQRETAQAEVLNTAKAAERSRIDKDIAEEQVCSRFTETV